MKTKNSEWLIWFVVVFLLGFTVSQAQISIVVSKSSPHSLSKDELKDVFAGVKVVWPDGAKMQVIDQAETETGKTFYEKFVGKSANQVRLQWTKLVLSGQAMAPKKTTDDDAVRKAVADDPNAVGYIKSSSVDGSVKELLKIQ